MSSSVDSIPLTDLGPAFEVRQSSTSQGNDQDSNTQPEWSGGGIIETERHTIHVSASNASGRQEVEIEQQEGMEVQVGSNGAAPGAKTTTQTRVKATKDIKIKEWLNSIMAVIAVMTAAIYFYFQYQQSSYANRLTLEETCRAHPVC